MTNPIGGKGRREGGSRRLGYRLLPGDLFSYILHLRPREWPIVAAHTLFGFLLAIPASSGVRPYAWQAVFGTILFVLFLNGGTLAINSAFDQDEGDIGYLDDPPPTPRHLFAWGVGLMTVGMAVALATMPALFNWIYAACFLMSILYSVPPFRWKAVAGLDLIINSAGFGFLTALAGWSLSEAPLAGWPLYILIGFAPLFAALYPLTQLYQFDEDRRRGDRTLALVFGMRRSLYFALAMACLAFAMFIFGLVNLGSGSWLLAIFPALAVWLGILLRWIQRCPRMTDQDHKAGMYHALQAWALTDIALLVAALGPTLSG